MCDFCKDIGTDEKAVLTHEMEIGNGNICEYGVYSNINSVKFASELREKHRNVLAGNSRKAFAEAVKLDKELKEYGNED